MRVAQVTFTHHPLRGGADIYAEELSQLFREAGANITTFQCSMGVHQPGIVEIPVPRKLPPGRRFWLLSLYLLAYRKRLLSFDWILCHYPLYCLPLLGHPGLVGLSHGATWDCAPQKTVNRLKKKIAQVAFRKCPRFVANDTFFLREMGLNSPPGHRPFQEHLPGKWFLPNCADTDRFYPERGREPDPKAFLLPRNLYRNRGIHLAILALTEIPDQSLQLRIVGGPGDPGYEQELHQLVKERGLQNRVLFCGAIRWDRMRPIYCTAEITLIPSLCGEGTSLSALESMACRTPVVATQVGGLLDLPCLHVSPEPKALAQGIAEVLAHREEYAEQQYQRTLAEFNLKKWKETWLKVVGFL